MVRRRKARNTLAVTRVSVTAALAVILAVTVAAAGSVAPDRVSAGSAPPYVGLWKAESTNVQRTVVDPIYIEFTAGGKNCTAYSTAAGYSCSNYDPYTAKGDIITVQQSGSSGTPWRYR